MDVELVPSRALKVVLLSFRIGPNVPRRHQPGTVAETLELATGIGGVVVTLAQGLPSRRGLALYIGLAGIALGME